MISLGANDVLRWWDRAHGQAPGARALTLFAECSGIPHGDCAEITVGERDRVLHSAYRTLFGSTLDCQTNCPACRESLEMRLDLGMFERPMFSQHAEPIDFPGGRIDWRLPTARDVAELSLGNDAKLARQLLLERCIEVSDAQGRPVAFADWPAHVIGAVSAAISDADPLMDVQIALRCPRCAHAWSAGFDVATFFWTELDLLAHRLFNEVHRLASVYGWAEVDILALSAARRSAYLERCMG